MEALAHIRSSTIFLQEGAAAAPTKLTTTMRFSAASRPGAEPIVLGGANTSTPSHSTRILPVASRSFVQTLRTGSNVGSLLRCRTLTVKCFISERSLLPAEQCNSVVSRANTFDLSPLLVMDQHMVSVGQIHRWDEVEGAPVTFELPSESIKTASKPANPMASAAGSTLIAPAMPSSKYTNCVAS